MFPCNACSGEAIRITSDQKQRSAGCAFCVVVSLIKMGFCTNPEKHCGCYANNPETHLKNHGNAKLIGKTFYKAENND